MDLPPWTVAPFVLLLLAIAVMPLAAERFWHRNRNKLVVVALLAVPVAIYLVLLGPATNWQSVWELLHQLEHYSSFIILLGSLYTISGGIVLRGDVEGRPLTNVALLALGAVLANVIGTTGASMLLIRPFLRINQQRLHKAHLPVFFIFVVSNLGGLLTPLGDPPLFLGFLNGVSFFWTLSLWPQWLVANGAVLAVFFVWDTLAYRREPAQALARDKAEIEPLRVEGLRNLAFLAGVVAAVMLQSPQVAGPFTLPWPWGEAGMLAMAAGSWFLTPARLRKDNGFTWGAIAEVAILFAGIFVTMVPALVLLGLHGAKLGLTQPWHYFWATGALSSVLDNAPTYMIFGTMAAGSEDLGRLMDHAPILAAISCGAVFMGANTYIGNGPNFMVKAIADAFKFQTPSFFGYVVYAALILLPIFVLITLLFFPEGLLR